MSMHMRAAVSLGTSRMEGDGRVVPAPRLDGVLVVGAGPTGMALTQVARAHGASGAPLAVAAGTGAVRPTGSVPLERAAEALDADGVPGTVKSVVNVS
jgi:NADPH-dependent 2,4-dienoyl-CoA reductase/sulfur reductase-like enzyme